MKRRRLQLLQWVCYGIAGTLDALTTLVDLLADAMERKGQRYEQRADKLKPITPNQRRAS